MLEKRSLSLSGHRTSVALEPEFWAALTNAAAAQSLTLATLVARIDESRGPTEKLTSSLRVYVLERASGGRGREAPDPGDGVGHL